MGFHAFGHGREPQVLPQPNNGRHNLAAVALLHHGADKTLVHFQLVEGQRLQVAQAGIAGAEIVQGKLTAQLLQLLYNQTGLRQIVGHGALCDLDHDPPERESS